MRKKLSALLLTLVLLAGMIAPAWPSTLNALPHWPDEAIYGVCNLDKPHEIAKRVADSFLFKAMALIEPDLEIAGNWLRQFPVVSASVALGMGNAGFSLQGAVKFVDGKKEILDRIALGKGREEDVEALINSPVPGQLKLVPFEGSVYSVVAGGMSLVLVSVDQDMVLLGFTPEDIAAAREALNDGGRRMKLDRSLPHGSFFYFHDNGMAASELQAESDGFLKDPAGNLVAELGLDASEHRFDLSVFTNFVKIFSLDSGSVSEPLAMGDRVLLGGGRPWLALMGRIFLEKRYFDSMKEAGGEDYEMAMMAAKQFGFDEDAIMKLLRAAGVVFGGQANLFGSPIPGGYMYISGEPREAQLLVPLMEMAARESGMPLEAVAKEGWAAFYTMREPVDFVMGVKGGLVVAGLLNPDSMDAAPELSGRLKTLYDNGGLKGFLHFDAKVLRDYLLPMLDPEGTLAPFLTDDDDFVEGIPFILQGVKAALEFRSLDITGAGLERADFTVITEDVKQEDVDAISALAEKWAKIAGEK